MPVSFHLPKQKSLALASALVCVLSGSCARGPKLVAVIPRSCGTVLWEPEHAGAAHLARKNGVDVYWNASPREDDVDGQIALLDKVVKRGPSGVILTPDETLPLRTPVRRIIGQDQAEIVSLHLLVTISPCRKRTGIHLRQQMMLRVVRRHRHRYRDQP